MPNSMEMDGLHGRGQADRLSPAGGVFAGSASSRASSIDAEKDNCSGKKRLRSSNHDDHHSLSRPHPPSTPTNTNNRDNHNVNHSPVIDVGATDVCMQQQKPVQKSSPSAAQSTSSITTFTFPTEERIISTLEKPETSQESQDYEAERRRILFGARTEPTDSTLFDVEALLEATKPYSITYNEDIRSNNDRKRPFTTTLLLKSVDGTVLARLPPMSTETAKFMRKHFPHLYGNKSVGSIFHDLSRFYEESGRHHGCTFDGGFEWERTDDFLWFSDIGTVSDDAEAHFHSILEQVRQRFESPHWSGLPSSLDLDCRRTISMIATTRAQRKLREYSDEKVMIMNALLSKIRSLSEERVGGKASREAIVGLLANVFADMREDANVPVFVSVSPFTMYIAAKLDIHRIVKSEISKTITVASGGATVHIYVYPNSQVPWVASAIDVALLLLPKMYNLPETEKNIAVCNIMMEAGKCICVEICRITLIYYRLMLFICFLYSHSQSSNSTLAGNASSEGSSQAGSAYP